MFFVEAGDTRNRWVMFLTFLAVEFFVIRAHFPMHF